MHPLFHYFSPEFHQEDLQSLWQEVCDHYTADEKLMVSELQQLMPVTPNAASLAAQWLQTLRETPCARFDLHQLLSQFSLNSDEGLALMSMAEALLRIPMLKPPMHWWKINWIQPTGSKPSPATKALC